MGKILFFQFPLKNLILSLSFKKFNPFDLISTSNKPHHQDHDQVEELEHVLRRSATTRLKEETKISFLREQLGSQVRFWMVIMESERDGPFHFERKWKCFSGCFFSIQSESGRPISLMESESDPNRPYSCHFFSTNVLLGSIFLHVKARKLWQNKVRDKTAWITDLATKRHKLQ